MTRPTRRAVMAGAAAAIAAPVLPALSAPAPAGWWQMPATPRAGAVRILARSYRRAICLAAADHPSGWELVRTYERILERMERQGDPDARAVLARYRQTGEIPSQPVEDARAAACDLTHPDDSDLGEGRRLEKLPLAQWITARLDVPA